MKRIYQKPDLKAPRFRKKTLGLLNNKFYKDFRKQYPLYKNLTNKQIEYIIIKFNERIRKEIIHSRDGVELLEQLGYLFVGSCRAKNNVDIPQSLEYNIEIQHKNWESDGFIAKIFYTNYETKYHFKNHELWGFIPHRDFSRGVSNNYRTNWKKYVQVDHHLKISRLFRKSKTKDYIASKEKKELEHYDEFAI